MKNKKGFTLIELVVSLVLVSIVLLALIGSLLQLRNAYTVVHENSDIIVYTSSVSRVINSDINDNNGIRYVSCEPNGKKCSLILGSDERRELVITDNDKIINDTVSEIKHSNNKTTLKYFNTSKYDKTNNENDKELLYIRTLELDKYENNDTKVTTTDGYNFYDMSASQYEYSNDEDNNIDSFTTITIRLLDGINMDVSNYNIVLYGAGRYDYSKYIGRVYKIDLDNDNATTAGTASIDALFGVGYYKSESSHKKKDEITKIEIPTKENAAFLGYYYKPYGVMNGKQIIDAGGNIVADARIFKNDVILNEESTGVVQAKWGTCGEGFKNENGECVQETYTVTLNKDTAGKTCSSVGTSSYQIAYQNLVGDVQIPQCAGYTFEGYLDNTNKRYHDRNGRGVEYYDKPSNATFKANWHACSVGQYSLMASQSCTDCTTGSYTSSGGSGVCIACGNGKTTTGVKSTSCNADCANNNSHVATWVNAVWNDNNTVTNNCKISTCKTGYDGELSLNRCTANSYSISYTLNSGSYGTYHPTTAEYDRVVVISNPTRAGYEFTGWTFNGNTSTAYYGNTLWSNRNTKAKATSFKNLTPTDEGRVTLTANWSLCEAGTYNDGTKSTCSACPSGSYNFGTGNTSCTPYNLVQDCSNNNIASTIPSNAKGLYRIIAEQAYMDNGKSEFVSSCEGMDFGASSSNTNGKGVYEMASTKDDAYPIYYYRGKVTNNNVKFGGFCWKAVRTTDTGGVKLIYNGRPDSSGHCSNTKGEATQIGTSEFNDNDNSPAYVGYMYGTPYTVETKVLSASDAGYKFGKSVTYSGGSYTLTNTITLTGTNYNQPNAFNNNHYTCFSESDTCTKVNYVYNIDGPHSTYYYIPILGVDPNGRELIDVIKESMFRNDKDSTAKIEIEKWYKDNMTSFTSKLEDTIYCNDRSTAVSSGWNIDGSMEIDLFFSAKTRTWDTYEPSLVCERSLDRFTVSSSIGNGKLKYPVGLLTSDEIVLAGAKDVAASGYYLYTSQPYWTGSPHSLRATSASHQVVFLAGEFFISAVINSEGLRPVVSLSKDASVSGGDGSADSPYTIST